MAKKQEETTKVKLTAMIASDLKQALALRAVISGNNDMASELTAILKKELAPEIADLARRKKES